MQVASSAASVRAAEANARELSRLRNMAVAGQFAPAGAELIPTQDLRSFTNAENAAADMLLLRQAIAAKAAEKGHTEKAEVLAATAAVISAPVAMSTASSMPGWRSYRRTA